MADGEAMREKIRAAIRAGAPTFQAVGDELGIRMQTVHAHFKRMDDAEQLRQRMAENKRPQLLEAFGEAKSLQAWSKDGRCQVTRNTLVKRIGDGWDAEDAISSPPRRRGHTPALTVAEAAALKAAADRVRELPRVHRHTPDNAPELVATRERNRLMRDAAGHASIAEIARAVGLSHEVVRRHIRGGLPQGRAVDNSTDCV